MPIFPASAISATATAAPPSEQSWTAVTRPASIRRADAFAGAALGGEVDRRRRAVPAAMADVEPERLAEMAVADGRSGRRASPSALKAIVADLRPIVEQADAADRGGGEDGAAAAGRLALVVERDVAAHDREVERAAGFAHAFEAADELAP